MAYVVVKNDIKTSVDEYVKGTQRASVLQNMKGDDFKDLLKDTADSLKKDKKFSKNDGATGAYDPNMFYEKPEPTTSAAAEEE